MFACVHDTGGIEPPSAPTPLSPPPEKGTLDRIAEEAEKLRRKCKSLRNLLLETETRRKDEKEFYEGEIERVKDDLETRLADLQTSSHIEICETRDFKSNELEQARHQLDVARNEVSMQGPLIIALTHKITSLEGQLREDNQHHTTALEAMRLEYEESYDQEVQHETHQLHDESEFEQLLMDYEKLQAELARREAEVAAARHDVDVVRREKLAVERDCTHWRDVRSVPPTSAPSPSVSLEQARAAATGGDSESEVNSLGSSMRSPKKSSAAQLKDAHAQIADLQETVEQLLRTKRTVEDNVRAVLEDNEQLAKEVDRMSSECERLKIPSTFSK
mmetsp:Transcript_30922/g.68287  ORF Transcript_30922/g.68287 Transcript_30922/m.68287 type:complete len:333 (-) Transcript_30922:62-1060(-)